MTINEAMQALCEDLAGVPDPLAERLTLALVWADLATIAGEDLPANVRRLLDDSDDLPPAA